MTTSSSTEITESNDKGEISSSNGGKLAAEESAASNDAALESNNKIGAQNPAVTNSKNDATTTTNGDDTEESSSSSSKSKKKIESMEIEANGAGRSTDDEDEYLDDDDEVDDLEQLLGNNNNDTDRQKTNKHVAKLQSLVYRACPCCPVASQNNNANNNNVEIIGNMKIVMPDLFFKTGLGVVGPHYFGPLCVILLILSCSYFFVHQSYTKIGPLTTIMCVLFTLATIYNLLNAAFRDPGIVAFQSVPENVEQLSDYRWCDFCKLYQPSDGAHCPDCNVCIAGYDHHCVWMGTCIGRNNFKQFVAFNLSWLFYLAYAIVWVSFLAPVLYYR